MRHAPTDADAEALLWRYLRAGHLTGHKFKRRQPIGGLIADFVCFEKAVIVEVDGGQHLEAQAADAARTRWLEARGFQVVRFWDDHVRMRSEHVLEEIIRVLQHPP